MRDFLWVIATIYAFIAALAVSGMVFLLLGSGLFDAEWLRLGFGLAGVPVVVLAWRLWAFCLDRA